MSLQVFIPVNAPPWLATVKQVKPHIPQAPSGEAGMAVSMDIQPVTWTPGILPTLLVCAFRPLSVSTNKNGHFQTV